MFNLDIQPLNYDYDNDDCNGNDNDDRLSHQHTVFVCNKAKILRC